MKKIIVLISISLFLGITTQAQSLSVSTVTITNEICNGGNIGHVLAQAVGGTSPYTYEWAPGGQTTYSISGLTVGTYSVTVTDNLGSTASATATVTQPTALSVSANVTANVSCYTDSSGSVSSTPASGTSPYTYSWTGGGTNSTKTGLPAGTYTISVTDNCGATASAYTTITQPSSAVSLSITSLTKISCVGCSNGVVSIAGSGGTAPYTYSWSTGASTTSSSGLSAGTYAITVTDANGCAFNLNFQLYPYPTAPHDTNIYQVYSEFMSSLDSAQIADTTENAPIPQFLRWYNFWEPRLAPTGSYKLASSVFSDYAGALHSANQDYCSSGTPLTTTWTEMGININSNNSSGRVNCIAFDPTNSNIMYVGGADGGVYQNTDITNTLSTWVNMGTDNQLLSLGVSDIAVEPANDNVVYAATGDEQSGIAFSDGIYRTTDANDGNSATWKPQGGPVVLSFQQYITQIALDPTNPDYLYVAVDDPLSNGNGGIYDSYNREDYGSQALDWEGSTWGFSFTNSSSPPVMFSSDAAFSVVAKTITTRFFGNQTELFGAGYDICEGVGSGRVTWTSLTGPNTGVYGAGTGLDLRPMTNATQVPFQLRASYFIDPINGDQLYLQKINLTLSSDGNYLYALLITTGSSGVYRFVARYNFNLGGWDYSPNNNSLIPSGPTGHVTSSPPDAGSFLGRHALAIDPNVTENGMHIFVGTTELCESLNAGVTWQDDYGYYGTFTPSPHVDYHAIAFQPGSSVHLAYLGTDGGLSSFQAHDDSPSNLQELDNGLGLSLDWDAQSSEQDNTNIWQALQDDGYNHLQNGIYYQAASLSGEEGDGLQVLVDYSNINNAYFTGQDDGPGKVLNVTDATLANPSYNNLELLINPGNLDPILLNPFNPLTMYQGRQDVVKAFDITTYSIYNNRNCIDDIPTTWCWKKFSDFKNQIGGADGYYIEDMAICPTDSNYLYAALNPLTPGDHFRFVWSANSSGVGTGGGTNPTPGIDWTDATPSDNDNYFISGIAVSYKNPDSVWITYSGYDAAHKVKAGVYSGGSWTWTDENTGLCNFSINCIVYQNGSNDGLYIGTDAGVYYKNASMSSWERLGTTFPNVVVATLSINYCSQKLVVGTNGRGTWETDLVPSKSNPLIITSNTTWTAPPGGSSMMIPADVEIQSPYTLTISSGLTVNMSKGHQINVEPGAKLVVNGTITDTCGSMWAGIYVEGNASQAQTSTYQGTVTLNSGSKIEHAVNGITTIKNTSSGWDWNYTGGIIHANGAKFYDNWRDIQFLYYSKPNNSIFTNCTFYVDNLYYDNYFTDYGLAPRVTMDQVHGVTFTSNYFANNIPVGTLSNNYLRSDGIYSIDASYSVNNCNCISMSGCCGTGNTFTGFGFGIAADNSNPAYSVSIIGNTFTNNFYDIDIQNINNMVITNNTFSKTIFEGVSGSPYNIYLDQCTGYNVSGNTLSNTYTYTTGYGALINNSGPANNLINNNTFNGIYVQSQAQGINGQVYFVITNPHTIPIASYSGLQFQCNQYTSSVSSGADISVASGLIDPRQGICTSAITTANNTFNNACGSPDDRLNIYAYSSMPPSWDIYYSTAISPAPYCESSPVYVSTCGSIATGSCATTTYTLITESGSILTDYSVNYHSTLRTQKQLFNFKADSLGGVLARGNTSGILTEIETGLSPTVILDSCLAPGPILSDSVLKTAIRAGLPIETLASILIPNTPLDSSVVSTLDGIGLPDTLVTRLNEYQIDSILSPRSILSAGINYFQGLMDYTDNALITALETDTNIHSGVYDSAQAVLKSDTLTLPRLAQLASFQWAANENSSALVTLDTIHRRDKDSIYARYCQLMPVLMTLSSSSTNGYQSLHGNSTDSTLLEHIAMDTLTPGYANARAVLKYVYNQTFDEPIIPLSGSHTGHRPKKNNDLYITGSSGSHLSTLPSPFNLYPNPANSSLNIAYSLSSSAQELNLIMYDVLGNKVADWSLPCSASSNSIVNENISSLVQGMYFYTIFEDNKAVQRGKLVIER